VAEAKTKKTFYLGTGRRKTSVARVRISEGSGQLLINGRALNNFFTEDKDRGAILGPLDLTDMRNKLDVYITISGGGITGQAGAASQGIARALKAMFGLPSGGDVDGGSDAINAMAKKLRDSGFLTRDGRMKERKKYGLKGARKAFQFSKR
jgi:small subunit ribosomal protein S9